MSVLSPFMAFFGCVVALVFIGVFVLAGFLIFGAFRRRGPGRYHTYGRPLPLYDEVSMHQHFEAPHHHHHEHHHQSGGFGGGGFGHESGGHHHGGGFSDGGFSGGGHHGGHH